MIVIHQLDGDMEQGKLNIGMANWRLVAKEILWKNTNCNDVKARLRVGVESWAHGQGRGDSKVIIINTETILPRSTKRSQSEMYTHFHWILCKLTESGVQ